MNTPNQKSNESSIADQTTDNDGEKTEILYGAENILKRTFGEFIIKHRLEGCIDHKSIAMHVINEPVWNALANLKDKGVKIKVV